MHNRKLIDYQPEILKNYAEIKEISRIEQPQIENLWSDIEKMFNEKYLETETKTGAEKWERILDIRPNDTIPIDVRSARIRARLIEDLPYTERMLKRLLSATCGENYYYNFDKDNFYMDIKLDMYIQNVIRDVEELTDRIVPANIDINIGFLHKTSANIREISLLKVGGKIRAKPLLSKYIRQEKGICRLSSFQRNAAVIKVKCRKENEISVKAKENIKSCQIFYNKILVKGD